MELQKHTTKRPLREVAEIHAKSRVLSTTARGYFKMLANGSAPSAAAGLLDLSDVEVGAIFYEAAASCSTRFGQSMTRRYQIGDLDRLRERALHLADEEIPHEYPRVRRIITLVLDVAEGPHDVDDTIAEWGAALPNAVHDGWGYTDDDLPANVIEVSQVWDNERNINL
jgi:hypothetical protein